MEGVRLDKEELIRRFGVSNRLAIRIGALLAKRVDVTATVLEMSPPGSPMEKLLCSPEVLGGASALTTQSLKDAAEKAGAAIEAPMMVCESKGWRTIAIEEEVLAEEGWKAAEEEETKALSLPVLQSTSITRREPAGEHLSPEQVRELKLTALTNSDEGQRAAAVRRLLSARIPDQEKAAAFFEILVDPMSRGRTEALTGFEGMGFNADASAALRDLLQGKSADQRFALDRLTGLLKTLDEAHAVIVTGVLMEALRTADTAALRENVLYALSPTVGVLAANETYLRTLVRESLKAIQAHGHTISAPARLVFHGIADRNPGTILPLLWAELDKVKGNRARNFLLTVIASLETDPEKRKDVAAMMARQAVAPGETESDRLLLGHNLTGLGEAAVAPLLDILNAGPKEYRAFAVPFLDTLVVDKGLPKPLKNEIAGQFLQALKVQDRRVRLAILETRVCADPDISDKLRRDLAGEFVDNLRQFPFPDISDRIQSGIEMTGPPAVEALFDYVKKHVYDEMADVAMRIIGRIVAAAPPDAIPAAKVKPIVDFCRDRLNDAKVTCGGYVFALGMICSSPYGDPKICEALVTDLLIRAWKLPYTQDVLTALGHLAASNHVPLDRKVIVAHIFLRVITAKKPDLVPNEIQTENGTVYEFGKESDMDTVVVPAAIAGMTQICLCDGASEVLRRQITIQLMKVWRQASGWVVIWSPLAVETLARSLGKIASSDKIPIETKLDIGKIIRDQVPERLSVVRALGEICSQEVESKDLDDLALDTIAQILENWITPESESDEWAIAITAASKIAARNALNPRARQTRQLRDRLLEILFDALRDHRAGARESLEMLGNCTGLPKAQRKEIQDRLRATVGLVKL